MEERSEEGCNVKKFKLCEVVEPYIISYKLLINFIFFLMVLAWFAFTIQWVKDVLLPRNKNRMNIQNCISFHGFRAGWLHHGLVDIPPTCQAATGQSPGRICPDKWPRTELEWSFNKNKYKQEKSHHEKINKSKCHCTRRINVGWKIWMPWARSTGQSPSPIQKVWANWTTYLDIVEGVLLRHGPSGSLGPL